MSWILLIELKCVHVSIIRRRICCWATVYLHWSDFTVIFRSEIYSLRVFADQNVLCNWNLGRFRIATRRLQGWVFLKEVLQGPSSGNTSYSTIRRKKCSRSQSSVHFSELAIVLCILPAFYQLSYVFTKSWTAYSISNLTKGGFLLFYVSLGYHAYIVTFLLNSYCHV